ncbi:MAG: EMC3/TMCO1 family protein [archaeon]
MAFLNILDPVLNPLLKIQPFLAIFIIALVLTFLITLVYKLTTDQKKMKKLKDELKESQKKMKALSKENPAEALKMQQQAMQKNMEYMKHSFKSTLYTLIPVLIIFAWLSANMAYYPITPDKQFTVTAIFAEGHAPEANLSSMPDLEILGNSTQQIVDSGKDGKAVWQLKGQEGIYKLILSYNNEKYEKSVLITPERKYEAPEKLFQNSKLKKITIGNDKVYPLGEFALFGLRLNWLWTYILLSILFSIVIRKLMKVY